MHSGWEGCGQTPFLGRLDILLKNIYYNFSIYKFGEFLEFFAFLGGEEASSLCVSSRRRGGGRAGRGGGRGDPRVSARRGEGRCDPPVSAGRGEGS